MKIIENVEENLEVRKKATNILLSWQPDSSCWNKLSDLTWRDPSSQMQAYILSTIHKAAYHNSVANDKL